MKNNTSITLCKIAIVLTMGMLLNVASADTATVNGITWTYTVSNGVASVGGGSSSTVVPATTKGAITIPSSLGGYSVTSIGDYAFYHCYGLTSVTIPNSVTNIGDEAFYGCSGLTSVTIPNSVTSIGECAFWGCSGLTSVTIPNSVTSIGDWAFQGCTGLADEDGFIIVRDVLYGYEGTATEVTIPASVTSIGSDAFFGCNDLTSVTIPNSVTSIGAQAFFDCSGLTSVTIPNSVTSIGSWAFSGCNKWNETIINISDIAAWCTNAINNRLQGQRRLFLGGEELFDMQIPEGVTSIGDYAFYGCSGLTSVTIPNSVTSIGYSAFSGCTGLTSVTIPDSVTSIGDFAFSGCRGLTSVMIPNNLDLIMTNTFYCCDKLWNNWYRTIANISAAGGDISGGGGSSSSLPYVLTNVPADRAIASVTVNADCAIDEFVLKDEKVYDSVVCVENTAATPIRLSLPSGYSYVTVAGQTPLTIPANSTCLVTITRIAAGKFLVSRQMLEEL